MYYQPWWTVWTWHVYLVHKVDEKSEWNFDLSFVLDENIQRESEFAQQIFRQTVEELERETEEKIR